MYAGSVTCIAFQNVTWLPWSAGTHTDELAVFRVAFSDGVALLPQLRTLLSPGEIERADRYRRPNDQLRFTCTRGWLRVLLARYLNRPPDRIEFVAGINRKPALKQSTTWHFNVSHSGNWALIAIAKTPVGIDLEWVNPDFSFRDVLLSSFSTSEQQCIDACEDARLCFYQLWTRKEALAKATAKGVDDGFARIPSLPGTHPANADLIGQDGHWTAGSFALTDGYPAAVAHDGLSGIIPQFYTLGSDLTVGSD